MHLSAIACAAIAAPIMLAAPVRGQDSPPSSTPPTQQELEDIRRRLERLEAQHEADQKRIAELETGRSGTALSTDELRRRWEQSWPATGPDASPGTGFSPQGNLFNPAITAFVDFGVSYSTNEDNKALRRFNLRESELDVRAAIAPFADGTLVIAIGEEVETEDGETTADIEFEVEEAYLTIHDLPGDLVLRGGKFRNSFGRANLLHTHDLPQATRPLALVAFFGPEGLATIGGTASWLVPNPWNQYIELNVDVVNADGGAESPILNDADNDNPAVVAHLKWFTDVGEDSSFELGGSYLYGHTSDDDDFDANIFGIDATWKWINPKAPDSESLLAQAEFFWAANDIEDSDFGTFRNNSFGFYAFAQYQWLKDWYAGVRYDQTEFPSVEDHAPGDMDWAISPYITWYPAEFLRLRLEYQHRDFEIDGVGDDEDNILFQVTFVIGAHPAHPYWVNR
jgi:hypothetical protein